MTFVERPVLSLRIAFAGKRNIAGTEGALEAQLSQLFFIIERRLKSIAAGGTGGIEVAQWFAPEAPRIVLISGLADGADQVASAVFLGIGKSQPNDPLASSSRAERRLAAILPHHREAYIASSPIRDVGRFRQLLAAAAYVVELDGDQHGDVAREASVIKGAHAAYRAQAEVLLRHADVLIALDNENPGSEGGTRETIGRALAIGLPVIQLLGRETGPTVLKCPEDLEGISDGRDWEAKVEAIVDELAAPPNIPQAPDGKTAASDRSLKYEEQIVREFYGRAALKPRLRQKVWRWFEGRFSRAGGSRSDRAAPSIEPYWVRAGALSEHYANLYRGTFLTSYGLAVCAVFLAVASLLVLALQDHGAYTTRWLHLILLLLELGSVTWMLSLARSANSRRWSERAADYRHLAEGFRTMVYLPLAGSFRPPKRFSGPFATRAATQSFIESLLQAIIRQVDPVKVTPPVGPERAITPDAIAAVRAISKDWIGNQLSYHFRNAATMTRMNDRLARYANWLSSAVILVVLLDVVLAAACMMGLSIPVIEHWTPWLLAAAAILPAAVASLNGLRFQSECHRLADRSKHLISLLRALEKRANDWLAKRVARGDSSPGPARRLPIVDALFLAEDVARLTLDEVADWSVLYSKEIAEA